MKLDYTLHPQATYRQMTAEVADALVWTLEHVAEYGGNPQGVVIAGHSAGAHLAALALMAPDLLPAAGHSPMEVCGLIGMAGVYDIQRQMDFERAKGGTAPVMTAVMEGAQNFAIASPIAHLTTEIPPILLLHGDEDTTVPLAMSEAFHAVLQASGHASDLHIYSQTGHTELLLNALVENPTRLVQDLVGFVDRCVGQYSSDR